VVRAIRAIRAAACRCVPLHAAEKSQRVRLLIRGAHSWHGSRCKLSRCGDVALEKSGSRLRERERERERGEGGESKTERESDLAYSSIYWHT